eukprot:TRINITY_DN66421_c2_g7_i1.p1 TRINITY_DN66421_c2_g7~~TRINITY_DN66421_c2_g7_i1.p1  ORF type:complete len:579 (-),score=246.83 TRINITY_DN66421_c2_g7_i1:56-1792(-)
MNESSSKEALTSTVPLSSLRGRHEPRVGSLDSPGAGESRDVRRRPARGWDVREAEEKRALMLRRRPSGFVHEHGIRLIDRSAPFRQAGGKVNVFRKGGKGASLLLVHDLFHTLLDLKVRTLTLLFIVVYVGWTIFFTFLYMTAIGHCNVDFDNFITAYYFSFETIMTIGYGASDVFFDECISMAVFITVECVIGTVLDAIAIGLVFERFSRATSRACTVLFSDYAVIRTNREGQRSFEFQVVELSMNHLLETHVQAFAVRHGVDEDGDPFYFKTTCMRIQDPDDEVGQEILITLPTTVTHHLYPDMRGIEPIASPLIPPGSDPMQLTNEQIRDYWRDSHMEVIVIIQGIEPATSDTIQARHSYTLDDVMFDHKFASCVKPSRDGRCIVDLNMFHALVPVTNHLVLKQASDPNAAHMVKPKVRKNSTRQGHSDDDVDADDDDDGMRLSNNKGSKSPATKVVEQMAAIVQQDEEEHKTLDDRHDAQPADSSSSSSSGSGSGSNSSTSRRATADSSPASTVIASNDDAINNLNDKANNSDNAANRSSANASNVRRRPRFDSSAADDTIESQFSEEEEEDDE